MKKILISILIILTFISCSTDNSSRSEAKLDLRNYLALLNHFGVETKTDLDLFGLKDSSEEKFIQNFSNPFCNQLTYSVKYQIDAHVNIPVVVKSVYYKRCPNMVFQTRNYCDVLLNFQGKVLFDGELCQMESIGDRIVSFYKKQDVNFCLKKANVKLHWDNDVDEKHFRQFLNQIIKGYFEFAEAQSEKYFHKSISELSSPELKSLGEISPFNLCVDFMKIDIAEMYLIDMPVKVCND